jgi:hypothetical protein
MHHVCEDNQYWAGFRLVECILRRTIAQAVDVSGNAQDARLSRAQKGVNEPVHTSHSATPVIDT